MMTQILVPLDGSPLAEQALSCATTLGRGLLAELVLFRAVSIPSDTRERVYPRTIGDLGSDSPRRGILSSFFRFYVESPTFLEYTPREILDDAGLKVDRLMQRLEWEAKVYLRGIANQLREAGQSVCQVVQYGPVGEAIVDYAEQKDIQWIVMATHAYTGIGRWVHGSVSERVLQSAGMPVLLVRAQEGASSDSRQPMPWRRVLVPLDGSALAEQVLPSAASIAQALGAEMILFRVPIVHGPGSLMGKWYLPLKGVFETANQDGQAYLNQVTSRLKEQGINASTAMQMGPAAESIIEYAEANQIDLIAMCTHGRTGLARWALGSVADRVLRTSNVPILLVHARRGRQIKARARLVKGSRQ